MFPLRSHWGCRFLRHNDTYFSLLCVPTRFTHYSCLLPFISLCRPQDSRSMGSSAGQVFLALEKAMFIYPLHQLLGQDESMWEKGPPSCTSSPIKRVTKRTFLYSLKRLPEGRTKNLLCFEPQLVLVRVHFVFVFAVLLFYHFLWVSK